MAHGVPSLSGGKPGQRPFCAQKPAVAFSDNDNTGEASPVGDADNVEITMGFKEVVTSVVSTSPKPKYWRSSMTAVDALGVQNGR